MKEAGKKTFSKSSDGGPQSDDPSSRAAAESEKEKLERVKKFQSLIDSVLSKGFSYNESGPFNGYLLIHPAKGEVFIILDGHHRLALLSYLSNKNAEDPKNIKVPIKIVKIIEREKLLNYEITQSLIEKGIFTESDVYKWFDNAFWTL